MKKIILILLVIASFGQSNAQVKVEELINLENLDLDFILGKTLSVKKGFAPKFTLGNNPIGKIPTVGKILGVKNNLEVDKLFRTFKTGRTIYRVAAFAGTAVTTYSAIRTVVNNSKATVDSSLKKDLKGAIFAGVGTMVSGLVVKMLTKQASYKAVDIFNNVARRKIKDILGVKINTDMINDRFVAGVGLTVSLYR